MITRDWQRLAFNLLLGPPLGHLVALACFCAMLVAGVLASGSDPALFGFVLFAGPSAIPLALTERYGSPRGLAEDTA